MFKTILILIIISVVAVFFEPQLAHVLRYFLMIHDKIADALAVAFSNGPTGRLIQETIVLVFIPVIIGIVAGVIWMMVRRHKMPHMAGTIWFIWAVLLVSILSQPSIHHATHHAAAEQHRNYY